MIGKIIIGDQEYKTKSLWKHVRIINEKYGVDFSKIKFDEYTSDILMLIIQDNPFKDINEIFDIITPEEMREIQNNITTLLLGITKEEIEKEMDSGKKK